ncbi:hypothetical protein RLEG3_28070 [Rhizobium leguminosarum bv. trifolii WSM1689]|nr:hypothetical protein RLEG3_28070 [Rhizobium leguminosarum bv. trifolii WSM1689]
MQFLLIIARIALLIVRPVAAPHGGAKLAPADQRKPPLAETRWLLIHSPSPAHKAAMAMATCSGLQMRPEGAWTRTC